MASLVAVQPAAAACDITGTVNGTASPTTVTVGDTITFNAHGFQAGEAVSFWFTTPSGIIVGTPAPIPGGVNSDGTVGPLPLTIQSSLLNLGAGRWAITFQGATSNNVAIMYFCVISTADATATAQAPAATNTSVPATNTPVPPTAVPATDTPVPPTAAAATDTAVPAAATNTAVPATAVAASPSGSLSVTDQTLTNNSVLITSVTASQDGWVVVHESNPDGSILLPGIIGKTAIKAGTTANVVIPLDKQVANGAKLWPMLHIDVGQIGVYEFPGPDVPVVVNGDIVMVPIIVAVPAAQPTAAATQAPAASAPSGSLSVSDQLLVNDTVIVSSVTASQDGWVVVHESNPDGSILLPGIIGKTQIKAGTTTNLAIVLDKQVANGAKLWPMLHIDVGQIGVYEFPGPDVPVVVNGDIVMVPIIVNVNPSGVVPGMPTTGQPGLPLFGLVALIALGLLSLGWVARRRSAGSTR